VRVSSNPKGTTNSRRVGLSRALSKLGYCSRSTAAELIRAGRVRLNGVIRRDPETPVVHRRDRIEVDGELVAASARLYLALNKPRRLVTTASDERGRGTVYSCLPIDFPWVAPVGRLDQASEGLLLMTNDSQWGARILDPKSHLEKTYHVQVASRLDDSFPESLMRGFQIDGDLLAAKHARVLRRGARNTWLEIVLDEGKNREIRRIFESLNVEVLRLIRVAIGPLPLGPLSKGSWRHLTLAEKESLDLAVHRGLRQTRLERLAAQGTLS
jgi:23S rRNA pseudouridine2605 synthase